MRALLGLSRIGKIEAVSRFRETEPVGFSDQPRFLNGAVKITTPLSPLELLSRTREIERQMGRVPTFRNGPRVIDIDLLDVRGAILRTRSLTLPHPRMHERRFVLDPLRDIAPRWRHPVFGKTPGQLIRDLESSPS